MPIEHVTGWIFRVARNRITDLFRKKKPDPFSDGIEDLLPSPDAGPDAVYARGVLLAELEAAIRELPAEQRAVFVAHELEGRSFKELAKETGTNINTFLAQAVRGTPSPRPPAEHSRRVHGNVRRRT
jgi:RNA polymerase sigma factor (sigma-70 family)